MIEVDNNEIIRKLRNSHQVNDVGSSVALDRNAIKQIAGNGLDASGTVEVQDPDMPESVDFKEIDFQSGVITIPEGTSVAGPTVYSEYRGSENVDGMSIADNIMGRQARVTGEYGRPRPGHTHQGLDLGASTGTPLYAPFSGTVVRVVSTLDGNAGGRRIKLQSSDGTLQVFVMHLSRVDVMPNQEVSKGQVIGLSGASGYHSESYYAPHVHYELLVNRNGWVHVDPRKAVFTQRYPAEEMVNASQLIKEPLRDTTSSSRNNAGMRNHNPGNDTNVSSPFAARKGAGGSGNKYHTYYNTFTEGYAGNAWQLLLYISGESRHTSPNPQLIQVLHTWVSPHIPESKLRQYERLTGLSRYSRLSATRAVILRVVLAIGKMDSGYVNNSEASRGVDMAISEWNKRHQIKVAMESNPVVTSNHITQQQPSSQHPQVLWR